MHLEDFAAGQKFQSGTALVDAESIKRFAAEFDPQPIHLDEEAGRGSLFGGLVASGWHTAAMTMKLIVGSELRIAGGSIGAGVEQMQWPRPVRPGDMLHLVSEVLEVRPSKSRSDRGIVKIKTTTLNQADQPVMVMVSSLIVPRRPAGG
jgi:acyl dehydratase